MLWLYDVLFTGAHLLIIGFNLLGWIWKRTRKLHLFMVILTLFCWIVLGIWYGMGYCPLTDWQWNVKERMGESDLPASFIKYFHDKITGLNLDPGVIDIMTGSGFAVAIIMAVYLNFFKRKL